MSEWDKRIRDHRVWNVMASLGPVIDSAAAVPNLPVETSLGLERLKAVLAYCGKRLAAADPLITTTPPLDQVATRLEGVRSELAAFANDRTIAHISNANGAADAALTALAGVPSITSPEELGVLVEATTGYRSLVAGALSHAASQLSAVSSAAEEGISDLRTKLKDISGTIEERSESIQSSLRTLSASIDAERSRITNIAGEQQRQFSTSQDARSKEFSDSIRAANETFTRLSTDYQGQFSAAQEVRSKEYHAAESQRNAMHNQIIADYTKRLSAQDAEFLKQRTELMSSAQSEIEQLSAKYADSAQSILEDVQEKQRHVEKLVGVIGNLGVTSGYLRAANAARVGTWSWQLLTVASLVTLSTLAYKTLGTLEGRDGRFDWGGFAARALLLVSLGVIAAYSGSQADKLFGDERRNRKLALELEAIGPYLAPLPAEEQNKFRIQIGDRSFGRDTESSAHKKSPASALDLLKSDEVK